MIRKPYALALAIILAGTLGHAGTSLAATSHDHGHGEGAPALQLDAGKRWATDAPLRAGMRNLREATETLNHYEMGHLDDTQRDNAVEKIDAAIKDMFANCKLKPEADAALHGLLEKFIVGANAARAGKFSKAELAPMQEALALYPQMFDDHDWSEAAH